MLKTNICQQRSEMYSISSNDCDKIYIGHTNRNLDTGMKEHIRKIKSYLLHPISECLEKCHNTEEAGILKHIKNLSRYVVWETLFILTNSMAYGTQRFNAAITRALQ